ncbi:MAG: zf-HC2 domain-containing protein [Planctomycetota bacterium]
MTDLSHNQRQPGEVIGLYGCAQVRDELHAYVEGELHDIAALQVSSHLDSCDACRDAYVELRDERTWLLEALGAEAPTLPANFASKVGAQLRAEQANERRQSSSRIWSAIASIAAVATIIALLNIDTENLDSNGSGINGGGVATEVYPDVDDRSHLAVTERESTRSSTAEAVDVDAVNAEALASVIENDTSSQQFADGEDGGPSESDDATGHVELAYASFECRDEWEYDPELALPMTDLVCPRCADEPEPTREFVIQPRRDLPNLGLMTTALCDVSDPCPPDPNGDGRTDSLDVVYVVQYELHGAVDLTPRATTVAMSSERISSDSSEEASIFERDCEKECI